MKKSCLVLLLILSSCSKEDEGVTSYLESFPTEKYFDEDVFSSSYQDFYGLWKALGSWGGWNGYYEPDFDFLEIKPFGIYGFVRNDTLFEYGKITPNTDIMDNYIGLPVKLDPEYSSGDRPNSFRSTMYFELVRIDTLSVSNGSIVSIQFLFLREK